MDTRAETALRVLQIFNGFDGPDGEILWWRTDDQYAPVTMFVNCNDLFIWACSDCEQITAENVESLAATVAEVAAIDEIIVDQAPLLWCCRQRGMKPQAPYYKHLDPRLHPLFDACGPSAYERAKA